MCTVKLEQTLAIIKPHAILNRFPIIRRILSSGLLILQEKCIKLTVEQAESFLRGRDDNRQSDIKEFCSGPLIALCLTHENAIEVWKDLMGPDDCTVAKESAPTSLRALYGDSTSVALNAVYGSASVSDAQRDLKFFFPNIIADSFYDGKSKENSKHVEDTLFHPLLDALFEMLKVKPDDPLNWIANYILHSNTTHSIVHKNLDPQDVSLVAKLHAREQIKLDQRHSKMVKLKCGCSELSSFSSLSR